jgi:hypothetical protein
VGEEGEGGARIFVKVKAFVRFVNVLESRDIRSGFTGSIWDAVTVVDIIPPAFESTTVALTPRRTLFKPPSGAGAAL